MRKTLILLGFIIACCSSSHEKKESETPLPDTPLINNSWKLVSPEPKKGCELKLSFTNDNKMEMRYRGKEYEGFYEIDSVLANYITINIFNKLGWDESCRVNPEYLSLYDEDTQFSYEIVNDYLYFRKNEKVIIFKREEAFDD
jgi:hypothetical protein